MVLIRFVLLAIALMTIVQADAAGRHRHRPGKKRHQEGDDPATFYYLVRQWPETFCEKQPGGVCPRQPARSAWSIHGLWPNYDKGDYPVCCSGGDPPNYEPEDIERIEKKLEDAWPSYKGSNDEFWEHEYDKHGTCNINDLNEFEYFNATLWLNHDYPIDEVLNDAGIVPSTTKTYATSEIEDVLAKRWGAKPEVMCSCPHGNWRAMCDTAQIDSILICVDDHLQIGDCTYQCIGEEGCERTNCETVKYLPLRRHGRVDSSAGNSTGTDLL